MSEHQAKPTEFQNVKFRSRSEAIFAAFCADNEWRWQFEPFFCPGGWSPDFLIDDRIAVDVRPAQSLGDFLPLEIYEQSFSVPLGIEEVWLVPTNPLVSREQPPLAYWGGAFLMMGLWKKYS